MSEKIHFLDGLTIFLIAMIGETLIYTSSILFSKFLAFIFGLSFKDSQYLYSSFFVFINVFVIFYLLFILYKLYLEVENDSNTHKNKKRI